MSIDEIAEINEDALFFDGFNDAIIGMAERIIFGPVVAYSESKIIEILIKEMEVDDTDMDEDEINDEKRTMAVEYYEINIKGAYMGEFTPILIITNLD
jgi:hypothetical protein